MTLPRPQVGTWGISYEGTAALMTSVCGHPAVRATAPMYIFLDVFSDVVRHPKETERERGRTWGIWRYGDGCVWVGSDLSPCGCLCVAGLHRRRPPVGLPAPLGEVSPAIAQLINFPLIHRIATGIRHILRPSALSSSSPTSSDSPPSAVAAGSRACWTPT